jgi:hypothetical protein
MDPKALPPEVKVNSVIKVAMIKVARRVTSAGHIVRIYSLKTLFHMNLAMAN